MASTIMDAALASITKVLKRKRHERPEERYRHRSRILFLLLDEIDKVIDSDEMILLLEGWISTTRRRQHAIKRKAHANSNASNV